MGDSGGGSGGGGSSGAVDYPAYMKEVHEDWLRNTAVLEIIDSSINDLMNAALGNSPFTTAAAYDPTTEVGLMVGAPAGLQALVTLLSTGTTLDTLISEVLDDSRIEDSVDAFSVDLTAKADANIYPAFEAGMRDINAVQSSAFVIGRALIADQIVRETSKYEAELRYKAWGDDAIKVIGLKMEYQKAVAMMVIDANRFSIVANKEETDTNVKYDEADALWDLELFQYGNNVMSSIAGASTTQKGSKQPSTAQSVLGGAMAGAAAGSLIAPGIGTVVGGVLGAAGGLMR